MTCPPCGRNPMRKPRRSRVVTTIGQTEALITHPDTGLYPHRTGMRDELSRALKRAADLWGADTPWSSIEESDWNALIRTRLDDLIAKGAKAIRSTEITVSRLITAVRWLRRKKLIAPDAGEYPTDWKRQIVRRWEGVTGKVHDPELSRPPKHTVEEARRILAASHFDSRLELLMWLGMGMSLGAVARARRSGLGKLPKVDWTTPSTTAKDYG